MGTGLPLLGTEDLDLLALSAKSQRCCFSGSDYLHNWILTLAAPVGYFLRLGNKRFDVSTRFQLGRSFRYPPKGGPAGFPTAFD